MATRIETRRAREALDNRMTSMRPASRFTSPHLGWVRAVRDALGMSAADLGRRMGISGASVRSIEENERSGGVRLSTLRRAAEAMECTLVYAFVSNEGLERTVHMQAERILHFHWDRVQQSMALEDQATEMSWEAHQSQLEAIIDSGRLWSAEESDR